MIRREIIRQVGDQVIDLLRVIPNIAGLAGVGECNRGSLIAPRRAAKTEVYAARIKGFKDAEYLGNFEGAIVGQHHAPAPDSNMLRTGGNLANHDFRTGPGEAGQIVMLGHPEAFVAEFFYRLSKSDRLPQGLGGCPPLSDRRLIRHTQMQLLGHSLKKGQPRRTAPYYLVYAGGFMPSVP